MKTQPEYSFERADGLWVVIRWKKGESESGRIGEKVKTFILKENARKEVYRLNGWQDFRLDFSYNWNSKLNGNAFTSIRLWNEKKYQPDKEYDIYLNGFRRGRARLVSIKRMRLYQISEHIARLDTGYSAVECREMIRKMYKSKKIDWDSQYLMYGLFVFIDEKKGLFD